MKLTRNQADANKNLYCTPECSVLEIKTEGVLCYSSFADDIEMGDVLKEDCFEQLFQ